MEIVKTDPDAPITPRTNKPVELGLHGNMTVDEAIDYISRNREFYNEIIITGYTKEDDHFLVSSGMTNKDALWTLEYCKQNIIEGLR